MARRQPNLPAVRGETAPERRSRKRSSGKPRGADANGALESFFAVARSIEKQQRQLVGLSTQALIVLEGERGRLARGLDCDVAQSLSSAMTSLQRIDRIATQVGLRRDLQELSNMIGSALRDVQRIARLLAPPIEDGPAPRTALLPRGGAPVSADDDHDTALMRVQPDAAGEERPTVARGEGVVDGDARPARALRLLLAEGHVVVRAGLRQLAAAEPDMRVVGEARDCREAVRLVGELAPDVVVIDLTTPTADGLDSIREIAALPHAPAILALSVHNDPGYLHHLLDAGASGYVLKNAADTDLMAGIRAVAAGGVFLSASAARTFVSPGDERSRDATGFGADPLSEREREVLRLTAEGYTNQEIGAKLYLSPKTVDTYRARITGKLDLHHRSELIRYALRQGLLTL
jgi:two-component system response regulator NreC